MRFPTYLIDELVWVRDDITKRIKQAKGHRNRLVDFGSVHVRGINSADHSTAVASGDGAVSKLCDAPRASDAGVGLESNVEVGVRRDGIGGRFCGAE